MITVRFPSGFSVQYNDLDNADFRSNGTYLGNKNNPNSYSVWVPTGCIIEHVRPCRTYDASTENTETRQQIDSLRREVRSLTRKIGKLAK